MKEIDRRSIVYAKHYKESVNLADFLIACHTSGLNNHEEAKIVWSSIDYHEGARDENLS